jgi:hypothetical protein
MKPLRIQQFLKSTSGLTWTWVIAAELLYELFTTVNGALTAFDARLGGETLPSLTCGLESSCRRGAVI